MEGGAASEFFPAAAPFLWKLAHGCYNELNSEGLHLADWYAFVSQICRVEGCPQNNENGVKSLRGVLPLSVPTEEETYAGQMPFIAMGTPF